MREVNQQIEKGICFSVYQLLDKDVLLNNLCLKPNSKFLEIGLYKGATFISALFDNPTVKGVGVEHYLYDDRESPKWAPEGFIWDNMKSHLEDNYTSIAMKKNGLTQIILRLLKALLKK